jgi:hypothetical protein
MGKRVTGDKPTISERHVPLQMEKKTERNNMRRWNLIFKHLELSHAPLKMRERLQRIGTCTTYVSSFFKLKILF